MINYINRVVITFETNSRLLKSKLKYIYFSTLDSHSLDKVEKKLSEAESIAVKSRTEHKDLVLQKVDKDITLVMTEPAKYLEVIKSFFLDVGKFMQLPIDEDKSISYIINLESKLRDCFKVLKNEDRNSGKNLIALTQLELRSAFL